MVDLLEELLEKGYDPEDIERIRAWNDASPVRREAKATAKTNKTLEDENRQLRAAVTQTAFRTLNIKVDHSVLNLPPDLAIHDLEAVRTWATSANLISTAPSTDPDELESHD